MNHCTITIQRPGVRGLASVNGTMSFFDANFLEGRLSVNLVFCHPDELIAFMRMANGSTPEMLKQELHRKERELADIRSQLESQEGGA